MEQENKEKDYTWPYLCPRVTCSPSCPGHPQYSPEKIQFTRFCTTCYNLITKKNKPRLQTRSLPLEVVQALEEENKRTLPGLGMVEDLETLVEKTCSVPPLKRPTCMICSQRLPLCAIPCEKCKSFLCKNHTPSHPCA